jgi:hypothetical protein
MKLIRGMLAVLLGVAAAGPAMAECLATDCYCRLVPGPDDFLLKGQLLLVDDDSAILEILDPPIVNPASQLAAGQILAGLMQADALGLQTGQRGLFRLTEGPAAFLWAAVEQQDGLLQCLADAEFPGASYDQVVAAVQDTDCPGVVTALGVEQHSCEQGSTLCGRGGVGGIALALLVVFGLPARRLRAFRGSPSSSR